MKLQSVYLKRFMFESHDLSVIPGRNPQAFGKSFSVRCQRVVPRSPDLLLKPFEQWLIFKLVVSGFSMHQNLCMNGASAEGFVYRLMSETYTENRAQTRELCYNRFGTAGIFRTSRSR